MNAVALGLLDRMLHDAASAPVAGLAAALGCSREAVVDAVGELRAAGCRIHEHPQHGLTLIESGLGCWADFLEARHARGIGGRCFVYQQTASTQQVARQAVGTDEPAARAGSVFISDHQSAGRGRLDRRWNGTPGTQVLLTAVVDAGGLTTDRLMLGACHAVCDAVVETSGLSPRIRWPNDVLIGARKLAGILIETVGDMALIGVGVNATLDPRRLPPPLDQRVTSLAREGRPVDRLRVLDALLSRLDESVGRVGLDDAMLLAAWRARSCLLEQRITVECAGARLTGRVVDLDPREGLMLAVERGPIVRLPAATTSLVDAPAVS